MPKAHQALGIVFQQLLQRLAIPAIVHIRPIAAAFWASLLMSKPDYKKLLKEIADKTGNKDKIYAFLGMPITIDTTMPEGYWALVPDDVE